MAGSCAHPEELKRLGVQYILVLGGGGSSDWRVVEGIRLWKHLPNTCLVLSGGREGDAVAMRMLPFEMGVSPDALIIDTKAFDTADEARMLGEIVGNRPFAMVTSAYHIPHAMRLFRNVGLIPVAAPCEYRAKRLPAFPTAFCQARTPC